ncbi:PRC-barrel domain-containing protein [Celeribacter halophilus]|uniref:PRC-barrel domain-containing protein n=1 Tax=Celeribacter halophilus TaxID=576117 RepID=A0A1I3PDM8_9RHOB|nr:PRC-barrel domain-containing protein [Celeribacter halophilus]PZX14861.1 PRC-barrel domain protein [Celeribacter halophilus]SFJ19658.1 PRC-barrel domain-containing protein [Celeribacter halophilus]
MKTLTQNLMISAAAMALATTPALADMTSESDATVEDNGAVIENDTTMTTPETDGAMEQTEGEMEEVWTDTKDTASDMADSTAEAAGEAWAATKDGAQNVVAALETFGDETVSEIVGTQVVTETGEDVGEIDAIVSADEGIMAIVGVGGFLGIAEHDVLIGVDRFTMVDENSVMIEGASEEQLKSMPDVDQSDYTAIEGDMTLEQVMGM